MRVCTYMIKIIHYHFVEQILYQVYILFIKAGARFKQNTKQNKKHPPKEAHHLPKTNRHTFEN